MDILGIIIILAAVIFTVYFFIQIYKFVADQEEHYRKEFKKYADEREERERKYNERQNK